MNPEPWSAFEAASKFLASNGLAMGIATAVFTFAVLCAWTWFLKWRREFLDDPERLTIANLRGHRFFGLVESYQLTLVPNIPIAEPYRRAVFKSFLRIKLDVFHSEVRSWLNTYDPDKLSTEEFKDAFLALFRVCITKYEALALADGIPQVVIDKFRDWHSETTSETLAFVQAICESDWYPTNRHRAAALLDWLATALHLTLIHGRTTLIKLNGELDKCPPYKGISPDPSKGYSGIMPVVVLPSSCEECERLGDLATGEFPGSAQTCEQPAPNCPNRSKNQGK